MSSTEFLIGLAAVTFIVAGLCFYSFELDTTRERLKNRVRVQLFSVGRRASTRASGERGARPSGAPSRLTTTMLRGDELEFARGLEALHISADRAPQLFLLLRLLVGGILASALVLLGNRYVGVRAIPSLAGLGALGAALGWSIPHLVAERLALYRRRTVARGLPDAIELLVISVESGMSLEDGISRIVDELRRSQPAVADELALTSADLKILPSRDEALRRLAERVNLPSVQSVVTTLTQTLRYGTPIAQALRVVAAELRNDALMRLEEQTNRMPVLLTIPMILFILPSIFLIILGPALLKVLDVIRQMH